MLNTLINPDHLEILNAINEDNDANGVQLYGVEEGEVFISNDGDFSYQNLFSIGSTSGNISAIVGEKGEVKHIAFGPTYFSNLDYLYQLKSLESISVYFQCQEFKLDKRVKELENLKHVVLAAYTGTQLPKELILHPGLEVLTMSEEYLDREDAIMHVSNFPTEILAQGLDAIRNYYISIEEANETENLFEAKMVMVGRGFTGKTSLVNKLTVPNYKLEEIVKSTEGIDIKFWDLDIGAIKHGKFRYNIWDFGGQEKYDATHQFFITARSLYIFVTEARQDYLDFDYWLNIVKMLSNESPIIVVQNKIDERQKELPTVRYKSLFNNIQDFINISCANKYESTIEILKEEIRKATLTLPQIRDELPKVWVDIRRILKDLGKDWIAYTEYLDICEGKGLNKEKADHLSKYFHDLGVIVHHANDPILRKKVILDPDLAVDGVYNVLDSKIVQRNQGKFDLDDLERIWSDKRYSDMHPELLALMENYELCFELGKTRTYIAPELLSANPTKYDPIKDENPLTFIYKFQFMPAGLITRFIVKVHDLIEGDNFWKNGVVIKRNEARAVIAEDQTDRRIKVRIGGPYYRQELLAIIQLRFSEVFKDFRNLDYNELTPCICKECTLGNDKHYYSWQTLLKFYRKGIMSIHCEQSTEEVSIGDLIAYVSGDSKIEASKGFTKRRPASKRGEKPKRVFISYSHKDEALKDELITFLSPMKRNGYLSSWDDGKITPGSDWEDKIKESLEAADIILLLVSADFLGSEYINDVELERALEKNKTKEAVVIPVILRASDWDSTQLKHLQALPKDGKPVMSWRSKDEAWTNVASGLRTVIDEMRGN